MPRKFSEIRPIRWGGTPVPRRVPSPGIASSTGSEGRPRGRPRTRASAPQNLRGARTSACGVETFSTPVRAKGQAFWFNGARHRRDAKGKKEIEMSSSSPASVLNLDLRLGKPPMLRVDAIDDAPRWAGAHRDELRAA